MLVSERQRLTNGVIEAIDANRPEQCPAKPRFDAQHEYLEFRIAHHVAHILTPTETVEMQSRATYDPRKLLSASVWPPKPTSAVKRSSERPSRPGGEIQSIWMEARSARGGAELITSRVPSTSRTRTGRCCLGTRAAPVRRWLEDLVTNYTVKFLMPFDDFRTPVGPQRTSVTRSTATDPCASAWATWAAPRRSCAAASVRSARPRAGRRASAPMSARSGLAAATTASAAYAQTAAAKPHPECVA